MKKKIKLLSIILIIFLCFIATGNIFADTTTFSITVSKGAPSTDDPYSKRTIKAGGSSWDNRFYVTPTSINPIKSSVFLKSHNLNNNSLQTGWVTVWGKHAPVNGGGSDVNKTFSSLYSSAAPSGEYYFMRGEFNTGVNTNTSTIKGRYTP